MLPRSARRGSGDAHAVAPDELADAAQRQWPELPDAELLVVAGRLNVVSNFQGLADPPDARPLALTCYPLGSTAAGSPIDLSGSPPPPPPAPPPPMAATADRQLDGRLARGIRAVTLAMKAVEEALGDLKLYRVPEPVTVAGQEPQAGRVPRPGRGRGSAALRAPLRADGRRRPAARGRDAAGHGQRRAARPRRWRCRWAGSRCSSRPRSASSCVAEDHLRDYAEGQDVELAARRKQPGVRPLRDATRTSISMTSQAWMPLRTRADQRQSEAGDAARRCSARRSEWLFRGLRGTRLKDGERVVEIIVPATAGARWHGKCGRQRVEIRRNSRGFDECSARLRPFRTKNLRSPLVRMEQIGYVHRR